MTDRRAEDLWVVGKDVPLNDGQGPPVIIFLRKMTPVDNQAALRRASAARARVRAVLHAPETDEWWDLRSQVLEIEGKADLVEYLLLERRVAISERVEAELAAEEEWANGYIQGLRDSWKEGMEEVHLLEPEDEEANRVWAELQRFATEATRRCQEELAGRRAELERVDEESLREQSFAQVIRFAAEDAWLSEYLMSQIFYGSRRSDDHNARYFRDRKQFDNLSSDALGLLRAAYKSMEVPPTEGKESEGTPTSSISSESLPGSGTGVSSGLAAVAP